MRITARQLAEAIDVNISTISRWRRRGSGFPVRQDSEGGATYSVRELLAWLDSREIRRRERRASDGPEGTYGRRLRDWLEETRIEAEPRHVDGTEAQLSARRLIEDCRRYFEPRGVQRLDVLEAALLLAFVWNMAPDEWKAIEAARGRGDAVVASVDTVLRRFGFEYSATTTLRPIVSANRDLLNRLVSQCDRLGVVGFEAILSAIADEFRKTPEHYRTPREVCKLVGACAVPATAPLHSVADLYNRHGELVLAVPTSDGGKAPEVHVAGIDPVAARRTRMHLIVRGRVGTVEVMRDGAPWRRHLGSQTFDAVLINPPFNKVLGPVGNGVDWKYGDPKGNSNLAWVQAALAATSARGRAVVLMPVSEGRARESGGEHPRQKLVDSGALRAIIRLSGDLFPATSLDTAVWVLEHPRPQRRDHTVVFVDATALKIKVSKQNRPLLVGMSEIADVVRSPGSLVPGEVRELVVEAGGHRALGRAVAVSTSEVASQGYVLTPDTYLSPVVEQREARLRRIQVDTDAAARARENVIRSPNVPAHTVLRTLDASGMPRGWMAVRLGEICEMKTGPSGLKRSHIVAGDAGEVPVLRPPNLISRRIDTETLDRTTRDKADEFAGYRLEADDIVVVRVGSVGKAAVTGPDHRGFLIDSNLIRVRSDPDSVLPRYLFEFLQRRTTIERIRAIAAAHVAPSVSGGELADFVVALPPLREQAAIVDVLAERDQRMAVLQEAVGAEGELRGSLAEGLMAGAVGL